MASTHLRHIVLPELLRVLYGCGLRLEEALSLRMRDVKVPGALVDHVYVDPDQWQTYITRDSPYYAGAQRRPVRPEPQMASSESSRIPYAREMRWSSSQ